MFRIIVLNLFSCCFWALLLWSDFFLFDYEVGTLSHIERIVLFFFAIIITSLIFLASAIY